MQLARIVIGVDLTQASVQAAAWTAQTFAPEADVVLLHCISPLVAERKLPIERQRAAGYLSYLAARIGPSRCSYRVEVGDPARRLADLAAEVDADLIAVGEHEDHPDREPQLGSTAERLVRCADVPVLLCAERRSGKPRSVLLPLESPDVGRSVAEWTEALAGWFHARVVLVHVQPPKVASLTRNARVVERLTECTTPWTHVLQEVAAERVVVDAEAREESQAVLEESKRFESDLVVLPAPLAHDVGEATMGRVMRSTECAVLIVPPAH